MIRYWCRVFSVSGPCLAPDEPDWFRVRGQWFGVLGNARFRSRRARSRLRISCRGLTIERPSPAFSSRLRALLDQGFHQLRLCGHYPRESSDSAAHAICTSRSRTRPAFLRRRASNLSSFLSLRCQLREPLRSATLPRGGCWCGICGHFPEPASAPAWSTRGPTSEMPGGFAWHQSAYIIITESTKKLQGKPENSMLRKSNCPLHSDVVSKTAPSEASGVF